MRLLVVTYIYHPVVSPRAFRWRAIAEQWVAQGHEVDVVCGPRPGIPAERVDGGVRVHAVAGVLDGARRRLREQWVDNDKAEGIKASKPANPRRRGAGQPLRAIWKKLYWPDYACLWYWPALEKGRELLPIRTYDGIISVSVPFTSHLVGYRLKAARPRVRWILDVGDPFSFGDGVPQNNQKLYGGLNRVVERRLFKAADVITVTTDEARERYGGLFPESAHKVRVVSPVYTVEDRLHDVEQPVFPADGKIRLVFMGTLYREIRNPIFLLELFARLLQTHLAEQVELHLFGNVNDCSDLFRPYTPLLGNKIFLHGVVGPDRAVQAMIEAHILVNIGNATTYQLPSKVIEYVSLGKPILNLGTAARDSSIAFLRQYPASLSLLQGEVGSREIQDLVRFVAAPPRAESEDLQAWLSSFRVEAVAAAYQRLMVNPQ